MPPSISGARSDPHVIASPARPADAGPDELEQLLAGMRLSQLEWPAEKLREELERANGFRPDPAQTLELEAYRLLQGIGRDPSAALQRLRRARELQQLGMTLKAPLAEAAAWRVMHTLESLLQMFPASLHSAGMAASLYLQGGEDELAQLMTVQRNSVLFHAEMYEELGASCRQLLAEGTPLPPAFRHRILGGAGAAGAAFSLAIRADDDASFERHLEESIALHREAMALAEAHGLEALASVSLTNLAIVEATRGHAELSRSLMEAVERRPEVDPNRPGWKEWHRYCAVLVNAQQSEAGWQALMDAARDYMGHGLNRSAVRDACLHAVKRLGRRLGRMGDALWAAERLNELRQASYLQLAHTLSDTVDAVLERPHLIHEREALAQRGSDLESSLAQRNAELSDTLARLQAEISIRQATEMALQKAHDELEAQVRERSAQLEQAMRTLMQHEKQLALSRMVAGMAHEMNTPLDNARMGASLIGERAQQLRQRLQENSLRRGELADLLVQLDGGSDLIDRGLVRVAQLVQRFKTLGHDDGQQERSDLDLSALVQLSASSWRQALAEAGVELRLNLPAHCPFRAHPQDLQHVLQQLLENSLIHGFRQGRQGTIWIDLSVENLENATDPPLEHTTLTGRELPPETTLVRLHWRDDGVGIPAEHLPRVLEPFYTTQLGRSGVGLGLTSVHRLVVERMGGALTLQSEPGQGTAVTIRLPMTFKEV
ncbi:ATP-binding protein [Pelomonas sp. APW6]|uniref:histidine kinase n=1 Tax=Roseateles subflavus TaxID=3053353 RepID=A0ABT7LRQ5_9BURK|nr:ATP-binding protein [Pelomonas sp. APW6]MDL5034151.1 ATP-binding protein [Pelomonas sp. APW6]